MTVLDEALAAASRRSPPAFGDDPAATTGWSWTDAITDPAGTLKTAEDSLNPFRSPWVQGALVAGAVGAFGLLIFAFRNPEMTGKAVGAAKLAAL